MMQETGFAQDLFAGKTVVMTGAGRGIGLAAAKLFKACGARLVAHSGRTGTALALDGIADKAIEADFSDAAGIGTFLEAAKNAAPHVDILINNAGTMVGRFPAETLSDADYDRIVMLNQTAVVYITRALVPLMKGSNDAAIVNTVSISAKIGGSAGSSIYSATKAFVSTYTKALARELAPDGIRANAVSPGTIMTDFHRRYSSHDKLEATRKAIPLQRLGSEEDCAPAYVFLASGRLSGYITGQVLEVNGGQLMT